MKIYIHALKFTVKDLTSKLFTLYTCFKVFIISISNENFIRKRLMDALRDFLVHYFRKVFIGK